MKPVYLEFCGVNSFSEKTAIDFRALISGGVFGIFGDTGSGKSTLLDCIHLALYGRTERSGNSGEYINYKSDGAYVLFDFEIVTEGKRHTYRVRRERRRKNNVTKAYLYEYGEGGSLRALAEGTRDVDAALEGIIGLTFADFKMCIALPQGDFAALVKAQTSERVKLVSRLFDLEKYGERLSKAVNEKYYKMEEQVNLVKAKMEQNEGGGAEVLDGLIKELEEIQLALSQAEKECEEAENDLRKGLELQKAKREYEALAARAGELEEKLPSMEGLRKKIEKVPFAKAVAKEAEGLEVNREEGRQAKARGEKAQADLAAAEASLRVLKEKEIAEGYDERIVEVTLQRDKVRGGADDLLEEQRAAARLQESLDAFNRLKDKCPSEDFDGKLAALEEKLAALGEDESLLDYLKHHCKGIFAQEAYGEIRADLRGLAEKHPTAAGDISSLIAKYTPSKTEEENVDIAQMNLAFKQVEKERKACREGIEQIKKKKEDFLFNEREKAFIIERGKVEREAWNRAKEKTAAIKALGALSALEEKLAKLQENKKALTQAIEKGGERISSLRAEAEKQKALLEKCQKAESGLATSLEIALKENGFACVEEAKGLLQEFPSVEDSKKNCEKFFSEYALVKHKYEEADGSSFAEFREEALFLARARKEEKTAARTALQQKLADGKAQYKQLLERKEKYEAFERELKEKERELTLCEQLRSLLARNRFLEFIASEYLQEICASASKTLLSLTSGRYFLQYDKEFKVGDNLDGGNLRAVKTLSGGETFLVSLSLALSLSAAICLKSLRPIEFFFLDEGFGTLDEKLVDTVMDVLAKLSKNFAVGLISHVEELKHRIDNKILVTGANEQRGSSVKIERF